MAKLKVLSAALIVAATLATPAMARESHVTSRHLAEDSDASIGGGFGRTPSDGYGGYGNRVNGLHGGSRGYGGRDVWGHWGAYYGPMIPNTF
jgi:uncharacterized membrane protein